MDVVFDVQNLTSEDIEMYAFVIAVYETDAVDRQSRKLTPYPYWRHHDPFKEIFMIHNVAITPNEIEDKLIWDEKDRDFLLHKRLIEERRSAITSTSPVEMVHPPVWKYLNYLAQHPTEGLLYKLYGENGPTEADKYQTNYPPKTPEEKRMKVYKNWHKHKYTLEHHRRKTVFRSHHYSRFRANYTFFNKVIIVLFQADKAKKFQEGFGPLLKRMQELQAKRIDIDKRKREATDREDKEALEKLTQEEIPLLNDEEKLRSEVLKLEDPLIFRQTYNLGKLKRVD